MDRPRRRDWKEVLSDELLNKNDLVDDDDNDEPEYYDDPDCRYALCPKWNFPDKPSSRYLISLSRNGLKSKRWGALFWNWFFSLAAYLDAQHYGYNLMQFVFERQFGSTGPCVHCRNSHQEFIKRPENAIKPFLDKNLIILWLPMIKNNVNHKLNADPTSDPLLYKNMVRFDKVAHFYKHERPQLYADVFWYVLYCQVINYPVDVSIHARCADPVLLRRCQDYVIMIEQMKNILPRNSDLQHRWTRAYFQHPPTLDTFGSRENFFIWTYEMQVLCGDACASIRDTGHAFETLRAANCKEQLTSCK